MRYSPSGRHIWITGASSGIGAALAVRCAEEGASTLILSGRNSKALSRIAEQCRNKGAQVNILAFDMAVKAEVESALISFQKLQLPLDTLILNAGISQRSLARDTGLTVSHTIFGVSVFAAMHFTIKLLPVLLLQKQPYLVAISSIASMGVMYRSSYAAAKAALETYMRTLALEEHARGLRVSIIKPGFVCTAVSRNALLGNSQQYGKEDRSIIRGMQPEYAAGQILRRIGSMESYIATPARVHLLRIFRVLCPPFARWILRKTKT